MAAILGIRRFDHTGRFLSGLRASLTAAALFVWGGSVQAHPHMWIEAKMDLQFDAQGQLVSVAQVWLFDEMFSSYAKQGLPETAEGAPPQAELDKIAKDWMSALADPMSHYFTTISQGGDVLAVGEPRGVKATWQSQTDQLSLRFELPLLQPVFANRLPVTVSVADPTYFVAYSFEEPQSVTALTAPASCQAVYKRPNRLDDQVAARLAAIPPSGVLPPDLQLAAQTLQHRVELSCP
jgi:ABC-type uncharacterized transport system substrate-binding protein